MSGIPTVKFNAWRVTDALKADLRKNISLLDGVDQKHFEAIYDAALRSISEGRDLHLLYKALLQMSIDGLTKRRAEDIARQLNNAATAFMNNEHQVAVGSKQAKWLYSGAPCEIDLRAPTGQDTAHRAANGKVFDVSTGMFLNGKWIWPGVEPGCKCVAKSVVTGFS
jgi:uncharacterized protein with gpF-like domain